MAATSTEVPQLYGVAPAPLGDTVKVRLHPKRETRDDDGKIVHTKPEYTAIDVESRQMKRGGEIVTLYRRQHEVHPEMGTLVSGEPEPESKAKEPESKAKK